MVRRNVSKIATLEQTARIGGVTLRTMIRKLRDGTAQGGSSRSCSRGRLRLRTHPGLQTAVWRKRSMWTRCWNAEFIPVEDSGRCTWHNAFHLVRRGDKNTHLALFLIFRSYTMEACDFSHSEATRISSIKG